MDIIISAKILLDFVKNMNSLKASLENIISFINSKIETDRISDKDTIAMVKYISKKIDSILISFFNYYAKLNKYNNVQELISKTADKDNILFSIIEKNQKDQFIGIIYPLNEYNQMIYDLENINTNMNYLRENLKIINDKIIDDIDTELKQPKSNILEFYHVKKYPVQPTSNYISELNNIIQCMENTTNYIDICIETIITYLNENGILKSAQNILDDLVHDDDNYDRYNKKVKYIFMAFNFEEE
jgi:hypothetical protein